MGEEAGIFYAIAFDISTVSHRIHNELRTISWDANPYFIAHDLVPCHYMPVVE